MGPLIRAHVIHLLNSAKGCFRKLQSFTTALLVKRGKGRHLESVQGKYGCKKQPVYTTKWCLLLCCGSFYRFIVIKWDFLSNVTTFLF